MIHSDLLSRIPLFAGLSPEDRGALGSYLVERRLDAGEHVFHKGDLGSSLYIVRSGAVEISLPLAGDPPGGQNVVLRIARANSYFGELSLFDDKPRSATVKALVPTALLELRREQLAEHLQKSRTAAWAILHEMASHLRETNELLSQRAARDAVRELEESRSWDQRLADKVAELNGSWAFILFLLVLTGAWVLVNFGMARAFDPYPYQFYNLALAILVALQGPLIVMSQNRQAIKERARAETDFRVNLKNEVGIEALQRELAALRSDVQRSLERTEPADVEGQARSGRAR